MENVITLDYGSGGNKTSSLIDNMILPILGNEALSELSDGAVLKGDDKIVYSTDSFVVNPLFFPGGNIGKLSVCGTVNDVAMAGGIPKYLSLSFIIEEGLPFDTLSKIIDSINVASKEAGIIIVTGDTKVVEKGHCDGIFINTSGIGFLSHQGLSKSSISKGDKVIVSGTIGDHGISVMLARNPEIANANIQSDCAPLNHMAESLYALGSDLKILRDPTRGGVATTLCEFIEGGNLSIELDEGLLPINKATKSACEMLGLDPMYCANEGKLLAIVSEDKADEALSIIKSSKYGENASIIGSVTDNHPGKLIMKTSFGGSRILTKLSGAQLPRIC